MRNAFYATVRQAGRIIVRSSFSPIIRDAFDFCVTIVAPRRPEAALDLDIVAMNESLAHFSGVMPFAVRNLTWEYGLENMEPGDLLALNNPYKGGNHIYDNAFLKPVFVKGELVGAIAAKVHLMDMGGAVAGGYSVEKKNIWEEGTTISGVPVFKHDRPFVPGFNLYTDNSRLPDNMLADIQAMHSACSFAEGRLQELVEKYSAPVVFEAMRYTLDYAEDAMRKALADLPDGVYEGEDGLDRDAHSEDPFVIRCRVNKRGDTVEADFSGTSTQSGSAINCPAYDAANAVYTAIKFLCDPESPNNSGSFRAIDVALPEGTFISALPPAATTMYFDAAEAVFNAVVKALLPAFPEGAFGGHFGTNMGLVVTGGGILESSEEEDDPARRQPTYVAPLISLGGFGASYGVDGENYVSMSQQNVMDMAVEALEEDYPLLIARKEFVADRAGPGKWRGGAAVVYDRIVLDPAEVRPLILHVRSQPWGAAGGHAGRAGGAWRGAAATSDPAEWMGTDFDPRGIDPRLTPLVGSFSPDGALAEQGGGEWTSKITAETAGRNTLYRVLTPGAGGWGDPLERDPEAVLGDVRDGLVSMESASRDYGVAIVGSVEEPDPLAVDAAATRRLREERRK